MNWADIGNLIKDSAPLIAGALLSPISAPVAIISVLCAKFGLKSDCQPQDIYNAIVADKEASYKLAELQLNHHEAIQRLLTTSTTDHLAMIKSTMLKEYTIENKYKSYWRPSFGYMLVFIIPVVILWFLALASFTFFCDPNKLSLLQSLLNVIISPIFDLMTWCIGVLGVNIYHRSRDKNALLGMDSKNLLSQLVEPFNKKK